MNKTQINAQIVGDSICPRGHRITTYLLTYPRIIHSELMTHRMFSRNAASSRAIPFKTMVKSIQDNPFMPIAWQKEHKGMQGSEYITDENKIKRLESDWLLARYFAIRYARELGVVESVTKQLCNRLLEPFQWYTCLVTATEYDNFFELRCPQYEAYTERFGKQYFKSKLDLMDAVHESELEKYRELDTLDWLQLNKGKAEIHLMELAECMWDARNESTPKQLKEGEYHIPFGDKINKVALAIPHNTTTYDPVVIKDIIKVSTSMAARTSYTIVGNEKEFTYENHIDLHDKLINQKPLHASPMEHCARVPTDEEYRNAYRGSIKPIHIESDFTYIEEIAEINLDNCGWFDNYHGFQSYRNILENETNI